jgi:hypothetical protein
MQLSAGPKPRSVTKSETPCVFCGTTGSLSTEHVVPRWLHKALKIREPVQEFSGATYVGMAETLAIVFHEVCDSCNSTWMGVLETAARPVPERFTTWAGPGWQQATRAGR